MSTDIPLVLNISDVLLMLIIRTHFPSLRSQLNSEIKGKLVKRVQSAIILPLVTRFLFEMHVPFQGVLINDPEREICHCHITFYTDQKPTAFELESPEA